MKKTVLLLGTAILALSACSSTKGPGAIGSKDDIVVKNNGLAQAQPAKAPGDFTSTTEQAAAVPAPEVAPAETLAAPASDQVATTEPLPDNSPAVTAAVQEHDAAAAPLPSNNVPTDATAPEQKRIDTIAPATPVTEATPQPPMQEAAAPSVYPAPTPTPAPEIAPASAPTPVDLKDPAIIRSAQAALKAKGIYKGPEDGAIDTAFLNALSSYQGKNQLPQGGLNEATLRNLGVIE